MTHKINLSLTLLALLASVSFSSVATAEDGDARDVVLTKGGNKVINTFGNCVRTKWSAGEDACATGEKKAAQSPVKIAVTTKEPTDRSRSYLLFFDFDKSTLTDDAKSVLNNLFSDAQKKHAAKFGVIGHADRSGTDAYNLALSKRRADTVKKYLVEKGVSVNITAEAKGESIPLVATEDGVREPQNRRAEIVFGYSE